MFENAKVGEKVWSIIRGWGKITRIFEGKERILIVKFNNSDIFGYYTEDGKRTGEKDENPELYWDEIKFEVPKKPFVLMDFLRDYLSDDWLFPKDFLHNEDNAYFYYDCDNKKMCWSTHSDHYIPGVQYFGLNEKILDEIITEANKRGVTFEEFHETFEQLGWL